MTQTLSSATVGSSFRSNPAVAEAIDTIITELCDAQSAIAAVRPPSGELAETYEGYLERIAAIKGKAPVFPYIGSGIGNGPLVELADGSVKWDMINGIGVSMFGHSDPDLVATALRASLSDTIMQGNLQANLDSVEFAELLLEEAARTSGMAHCFLTNSGAVANESALKICMQKRDGKAPRIIAFTDCFMGRTTTMAQIGDSAAGRVGIPLNVHVDYVSFYDPEQGEQSINDVILQLKQCFDRYPDQHACFVMELVQGEGGFNIAPREFFEPLMKLCKEHNVPVWADEVQTFGRCEQMFCFEQLGIGEYIDVITLGKMSQVCACLYTKEMNPKPGLLSGTFIGSTISLQVGKRLLERLREGGYYGANGRIAALQQTFRQQAQRLVAAHPEWFPPVPHPSGIQRRATSFFGGVGGMMRLTPFGGDKALIWKALHALYEKGVIAFYCGHDPYHIRFLPPVGVMQPEHFNDVFAIVEEALAQAAGRTER